MQVDYFFELPEGSSEYFLRYDGLHFRNEEEIDGYITDQISTDHLVNHFPEITDSG
ncbi:MAG: hypothetical protein R8G66_07865 [Cytophagales bacterium]|nr:hypothetical protein [Cytophagales bacterium]